MNDFLKDLVTKNKTYKLAAIAVVVILAQMVDTGADTSGIMEASPDRIVELLIVSAIAALRAGVAKITK